MEIKYYINGTNLKTTYGVNVSGSNGVIDSPKLKEPFSVNIPNQHGEVVDLTAVYYEPKTIELECFVAEASNLALAEKINTLRAFFKSVNLHRLMITIEDTVTKPLVYEVYLKDEIQVNKTWRANGMVVGSFTLKFIEPIPYKKVLYFNATGSPTSITLAMAITKSIQIHWGDGNVDYYVTSSATHEYSVKGKYYIIIVGDIDDFTISDLGGSTVVWERFI